VNGILQTRTTKIIKGLGHLSYEENLRELIRLEERKLWGDVTVASQCLKGAFKQQEDTLFMWCDSDRIRGKGFEVEEGRFRLAIRKKFCTQRQ